MTDLNPNCLVWAEIPVTDLERAKSFYETLLEAELSTDTDGPNPIVVLPYSGVPGASGHLYPGKPAANGEGITAHLQVKGELNAAKDRIEKGGGQVVSDNITIPAGTFFYAVDTEGNSIGIFKV